jgi:hypothetical protein
LIGNLYREGKLYTQEALKVFDHDFPYLSKGVIIPYGIYDIATNHGFVVIGTSKDTSEFVCDCIKAWWLKVGIKKYPQASSILALADGGGSNSSRHYIFKEDLQKLVDELGIEIRIAHYPPYTSKWNPIEHRMFPHVTRAMQGVILKSHSMVKQLIEKTKTKQGLRVQVEISEKEYQIGRKYAKGYKENMKIIFDKYLGNWNYRAVPRNLS